jgi:hypothetical protein
MRIGADKSAVGTINRNVDVVSPGDRALQLSGVCCYMPYCVGRNDAALVTAASRARAAIVAQGSHLAVRRRGSVDAKECALLLYVVLPKLD